MESRLSKDINRKFNYKKNGQIVNILDIIRRLNRLTQEAPLLVEEVNQIITEKKEVIVALEQAANSNKKLLERIVELVEMSSRGGDPMKSEENEELEEMKDEVIGMSPEEFETVPRSIKGKCTLEEATMVYT